MRHTPSTQRTRTDNRRNMTTQSIMKRDSNKINYKTSGEEKGKN